MILPACRLVAAVQAREPEGVAGIVEALSVLELRALAVVLAELVPADDPAMDLFTLWKVQDNELPLLPVTAEQAEANRQRLVDEVAEYEHAKRSAA
jgi:hypothetical protein